MKKTLSLALALVALSAFTPAPQTISAAPAVVAAATPSSVLHLALADAPPAQVVQGAPVHVDLQGDYEHPEDAQIEDVVADVKAAATAGRWWLLATLGAFLGLLLLRKMAPVGSPLERWLHTTPGMALWGTGLAVLGQAGLALADLSVVDAKTFGGVLATAATTVLLAKVKDSAPTPAAQAVRAAKTESRLAA